MTLPQVLAWNTEKDLPVLLFSAGCYYSRLGMLIWMPQYYVNQNFRRKQKKIVQLEFATNNHPVDGISANVKPRK